MVNGVEIKRLRIKSKLSQAALAELSGVRRENLLRIESGKRICSDELFLKIIKSMGYGIIKKIVKIK